MTTQIQTASLDEILGFAEKKTLHTHLREYAAEYGQEDGPGLFWRDVLGGLQGVCRKSYLDRLAKANLAESVLQKVLHESADSTELASSLNTIDRATMVYNQAKQLPADISWKQWIQEEDVQNFRRQERTDEASFPDLPIIAENAEFEDAVQMRHREWTIQTRKRGRTFNLSFEAQVNDDLGRLSTMSAKMGVAALRTLAREVAISMWNNIPSPVDGFQMWSFNHLNVWPGGITGIDLYSANLIQSLINVMLAQRDSQLDPKSKLTQGNLIINAPKYIVCGRTQWQIIWHLLNDPTIPDVMPAPNMLINNPLIKYRDMGLELIMDPYLDEAAGGNCLNVYLFSAPAEYTPAFTMAYLSGTGRAPILAMSKGDWLVNNGTDVVEPYDIFLKKTFMVLEFARLNAQVWEGTAALIPNFQPGAAEVQVCPWSDRDGDGTWV